MHGKIEKGAGRRGKRREVKSQCCFRSGQIKREKRGLDDLVGGSKPRRDRDLGNGILCASKRFKRETPEHGKRRGRAP